jgi:hypothetical protein
MKTVYLAVAMSFLPGLVSAQVDTAPIKAVIEPMMSEVAPGPAAVVLTECIIAHATAVELATFAAAAGPSNELGAMISAVLARPETLGCVSAAAN